MKRAPRTSGGMTGGPPVLHVVRNIALFACALAGPLATASCWPGWDFLFDQTPSREHRVEDLRVLAIELEPASIVFTPTFARDGGAPFTLQVRPVIFDPRGGDIDVDVSLCFTNNDGISPCASIGGEVVRRTVTASSDDPLGIVELDETFTISHEVIVDLFDVAGVPITTIGGVHAGVVVNVSRVLDGKRERERAELFFPVEVDPFGEGTTPELFAESAGDDCSDEPEDVCFPGQEQEPECGNGIVEPPFEQCDPPEPGVCDECFAIDFCQAAASTICIEPVAVNTRPLITAVFVLGNGEVFPNENTPRIEPGGTIELTPGERRFVFADSPSLLTPELAQPAFSQTFCPEGSPGRRTSLECGLVPESLNQRVYVGDARAELVGSFPGEEFFGNPQFGPAPVGVMFAADTPPGTREPLVVVLSDGDGGMDLALFTLEAR
jgi:hypothetical protein